MAWRTVVAVVVILLLAGCTCGTCNRSPRQQWGKVGKTGYFYDDGHGGLRDGDGARIVSYGGKTCPVY